jgi:hypothetical protein
VIGKSGTLANINLPMDSLQAAVYANTNQIKTWTNGVKPTTNAANSLTSDPSFGYTYYYDPRGMLAIISGGTTYNYDSLGRRESVVVSGAATTYLYDGGIPVQVVNGSTTANFVTARLRMNSDAQRAGIAARRIRFAAGWHQQRRQLQLSIYLRPLRQFQRERRAALGL